MEKRVYRSSTNKMVSGVCGGLGEYFEVDPVLVRVVAVLLTLATGMALVAYIFAWMFMPRRPQELPEATPEYQGSSWHKYLPGLILMGIGIVLLIRDNWYWFDWGEFWPVLLIVVGLALIFRRKQRRDETAVNLNVNNHHVGSDNGGTTS